MQESNKISTGKVLIAEPFMTESTFSRTVIGICDHDEKEGTVGFILNKPIKVKIQEIIPDITTEESFKVGYGGPVATDTIHYIHNVGELLDESLPVTRGVYWSGNFEKLKFLINSGLVKHDNIRFYIGYSGWSEGQLLDELISSKSWMVSDLDPNYVFKTKPRKLWEQVLKHKGDTFSVISQIPNSQRLN
ncbi:MAG: YqgE/AlgH family protein [Saprospiraceae bacterium]|nr:YqgE/AlgH family protein [Bacteroidia bacterium]NNL92749.1 YqgE/AlgH family protein [Saprospiraceae bacterium]